MTVISGKVLKLNGWPEGPLIRLAKDAAQQLWEAGLDRDAILERLNAVRANPAAFQNDEAVGELARELTAQHTRPSTHERDESLREQPVNYRVWGREFIDPAALTQMDNAARLPVSVAGALMPDAHVGYGLPIGGVLATEGAVIPYAVGVDIACRMRLSIYDVSPIVLGQKPGQFEKALLHQTRFGMGAKWGKNERPDHPVLEDEAWDELPLLRHLHDVAVEQLGTSGTGNHFVEWGEFELQQPETQLGLAPGRYLALLSHSGSRGVGFKIAEHYSRLAMELHPKLEKSVRHLAWLDLDTDPGREYWLAMELAGRFASANHAVIHQRVSAAVGLQEVASVENHHNFAWVETLPDGRRVIVHRKGATPAGPGVLGVIPGSMGDAGFVVRGRGVPESLNSAAHGAGRQMSRKQALHTITKSERDRYLRERGITLLGGGLDESPQAYKRIADIIAAQSDLVDIVGKFTPRIVRMAEEPGDW
ncbi:MAG: RtcB family protein [Anaerolineales bacterium]|nr:RtcB family protein [Anaerolineales bacterium]